MEDTRISGTGLTWEVGARPSRVSLWIEQGGPGPPAWELSTYPDAQADDPVSGVSRFEAVGYCQCVGKGLPTGRALVYPVYKGTHERSTRVEITKQLGEGAVQWSKDLGRTLDYLNSRSDFDKDTIAFYSFSVGATYTLPVIAIEPRLKSAILLPADCPMKCYRRKRHRPIFFPE